MTVFRKGFPADDLPTQKQLGILDVLENDMRIPLTEDCNTLLGALEFISAHWDEYCEFCEWEDDMDEGCWGGWWDDQR